MKKICFVLILFTLSSGLFGLTQVGSVDTYNNQYNKDEGTTIFWISSDGEHFITSSSLSKYVAPAMIVRITNTATNEESITTVEALKSYGNNFSLCQLYGAGTYSIEVYPYAQSPLSGQTSFTVVVDDSCQHSTGQVYQWNWVSTVTNNGNSPVLVGLTSSSNPNAVIGGSSPVSVGAGQTVTLSGSTYGTDPNNSGSVNVSTFGLGITDGNSVYVSSGSNAVQYSDLALWSDSSVNLSVDTDVSSGGVVTSNPFSDYESKVSSGSPDSVQTVAGSPASVSGNHTNSSDSPQIIVTKKWNPSLQKYSVSDTQTVPSGGTISLDDSDPYGVKKVLAVDQDGTYHETYVLTSDETESGVDDSLISDAEDVEDEDSDSPYTIDPEDPENTEDPEDPENTDDSSSIDVSKLAKETTLKNVNEQSVRLTDEQKESNRLLRDIRDDTKDSKQTQDEIENDLSEIIQNQKKQIELEQSENDERASDKEEAKGFLSAIKTMLELQQGEWWDWGQNLANTFKDKAEAVLETIPLQKGRLLELSPDKTVGNGSKPDLSWTIGGATYTLPLDDWLEPMNWCRECIKWLAILYYAGFLLVQLKEVITTAFLTPQAKSGTTIGGEFLVKLESKGVVAFGLAILIITAIAVIPVTFATFLQSNGALDLVDILASSPFGSIPASVQGGFWIIEQMIPVSIMIVLLINRFVVMGIASLVTFGISSFVKIMAI